MGVVSFALHCQHKMSSPQEIIASLSRSLPLFIIEQYEKLLAIIDIKLPPNPSQEPSHRFWDLFNAHAEKKGSSLEVAVTYLHTILNGLEWKELAKLKVFIKNDVKVDIKVTEALKRVRNDLPKRIIDLGDQLGEYQLSRYRLAVSVLINQDLIPPGKPFNEVYSDILLPLLDGSYPLAIAFTIGVLERSGWGDTRRLKPFADRSVDFNTQFSKVDLCLTVADYYGNMSDRDFSSAKVYTSAVHLNNHSVSNKSRIEFTLLLMKREIISVGDVSNIEDKVRYPIFFKDYKKRSENLPKEMNPQHMATPEQQQDTHMYATTTDLSSSASECTEDTEQSSITVSHRTTSTPAASLETTQSSGTTVSSYCSSSTVTDAVLDSAPIMLKVVKFLKPFESQWHLIGVSLELEMDKLQMIDYHNNSSCLATVLNAWKSSPGSVPYTWRSVIDVVEALGDNDSVKREIETFLLRQ